MPLDPAAAALFESPRPPVLALPHLITALDAELLGQIVHLTKARPAMWDQPALFDEHDVYDDARGPTPLAAWALPLNQTELLTMGAFVAEAIFAEGPLLLDSAADESAVAKILETRLSRLPTGGLTSVRIQDMPALPALVEATGWLLVPVGASRDAAMFVTSPALAELVEKLRQWCDRQGRDHARLTERAGEPVLVAESAPAETRDQAIDQRIDSFLHEMEIYFGGADESIPARVGRRITARRQLRERVRAAQAAAGPMPRHSMHGD